MRIITKHYYHCWIKGDVYEQKIHERGDLFEDILTNQKYITETYNTFANECKNLSVRNDILNLLNEEHQLESDVFDEMHRRGWYPTVLAEPLAIDEAKTKYENEKP